MRQFFSVVEPSDPTNSNLATLDDVKLELGITTDADDAQLELHITRISKAFADLLDRTLALSEVLETFVFDTGEVFLARQPLLLRQYPVVEIDSVSIDGGEIDNFEYDAASGRIWRTSGSWSGRVEISYRGGFDLPDDAPLSLQWALIEAIRQRRAFASSDPTVRSTTHGDTSVTFYSEPMAGGAGFSRIIIDALTPFRRIAI